MLIAIGALVCALPACAYQAPNTAPDPASGDAEPLRVLLHTRSPDDLRFRSIGFDLNHPAYVAVFEILPDQGIRLLYPWYGQPSEHFDAGVNFVSTTLAAFGEYIQSAVLAGSWPRFLYVVASEEPIDMSRFSEPGSVRSYVGLMRFTSDRPFETMNELTTAVLPATEPDEAWASDMLMEWPGDIPGAATGPLQILRCASGRLILIPVAYGFSACPGDIIRAHGLASAPHTAGTPGTAGREPPHRVSRGTASVFATTDRASGFTNRPHQTGVRAEPRTVHPSPSMPRGVAGSGVRASGGARTTEPAHIPVTTPSPGMSAMPATGSAAASSGSHRPH